MHFGAEVKVKTSKGAQWWIVSTSGSYLSATDKRAHFRLGADEHAKSVEILWPSGTRQELGEVKGNRILRVDEPVK